MSSTFYVWGCCWEKVLPATALSPRRLPGLPSLPTVPLLRERSSRVGLHFPEGTVGVESGVLSRRFPCWGLSLCRTPLSPHPTPASARLFNLGDEPGLPFLEKYPTPPLHLPGLPQAGLLQRALSSPQFFSGKLDRARASPRKRACVRKPGDTFQAIDFKMGLNFKPSPFPLPPSSPHPPPRPPPAPALETSQWEPGFTLPE